MRLAIAALFLTTVLSAQSPSVNDVLQRAGVYALAYEQNFSLLVAEENYEQRTVTQMSAVGGGNLSQANPGGGLNRDIGKEMRRTLKSDYLLVHLDGGGWMPFRDVFEVDGRKERNRQDRVLNLFLKPSPTSLEQAQRIMSDSTRFNLGSVQRTINIPTLAVLLAQPELATRFTYDRQPDENVASRQAWVLDYRETARPTLIKTSQGQDLPLSGRLWVEPNTGVILKTRMLAADADVRAVVTVTFREDKDLRFWVPSKMEETYGSKGSEEISCAATYTNYRRFKVATDETLKKPAPM